MRYLFAILSLLVVFVMADAKPNHNNIKHIPGVHKPANQPNKVYRSDTSSGHPIAPVHLGVFRQNNYHINFGTRFPVGHRLAGQFFYRGYNHRHWTHWRYYPSYGCYLYWCPYTTVWYYWCGPDLSYYPITYVPYNSYTVNVNVENNNAPPEPPAPMTQPPMPPG